MHWCSAQWSQCQSGAAYVDVLILFVVLNTALSTVMACSLCFCCPTIGPIDNLLRLLYLLVVDILDWCVSLLLLSPILYLVVVDFSDVVSIAVFSYFIVVSACCVYLFYLLVEASANSILLLLRALYLKYISLVDRCCTLWFQLMFPIVVPACWWIINVII